MTRTEIHSAALNFKNILISLVFLAIIMGIRQIYFKPFLDFTLSDKGIPHIQKVVDSFWKKIFLTETELGGGKELLELVVIGLIWSHRSRALYYLMVMGIDKIIVGYYKLAYANPRPYMISDAITPITCSKAFGNPSGHSSASSLFAIAVFLDVFHGQTNSLA
jgi:hypothetical protein